VRRENSRLIGKYLEKFCYEVSAFAAGSDLLKVKDIKQKFTPEFIEKNVVRKSLFL